MLRLKYIFIRSLLVPCASSVLGWIDDTDTIYKYCWQYLSGTSGIKEEVCMVLLSSNFEEVCMVLLFHLITWFKSLKINMLAICCAEICYTIHAGQATGMFWPKMHLTSFGLICFQCYPTLVLFVPFLSNVLSTGA